MEVHDSGQPWLVVTGRAAALAERAGHRHVAPLADHDGPVAIAIVAADAVSARP